ncbi:MAG: hypothetical protein WEF50_19305 [Myxococcota bacterium]
MESPGTKVARIELKLRDINQLFHTLDPSPFRERSLDEGAETFVVSWARDLPHKADLELLVHVPDPGPDDELRAQVETAVQSHFQYLAEVKRREFRQLMARGRTSLLIGLTFLAVCMIVGNALTGVGSSALFQFGRESLLIGGWVAMWRPIEIFLYDWWGVRRQQRDYERLGRMPVRLSGRA